MTSLVVDRSTETQSAALVEDGRIVSATTIEGTDSRSGEWVPKVWEFMSGCRPSRIVVGTGPGSFAGIRAALAFAQGIALGSGAEVLGLPSPCSCARQDEPVAVVGDARRGKFWIALFDGFSLATPIFQVEEADLPKRVPQSAKVFTPDAKRIGGKLAEMFGDRYDEKGGVQTAEGLAKAFLANSRLLVPEPLPIYLNPAVRD